MSEEPKDFTLPAIAPAASSRLSVFSEAEKAALRRLRDRSLTPNTRRALRSDLEYLSLWCEAATGTRLTWPAEPSLLVRFVAHHFEEMPPEVRSQISIGDPDRQLSGEEFAVSTVLRMISTWKSEHDRLGVANPLRDPAFVQLVRDAARADPRRPGRKSRRAVMREEMGALVTAPGREDDPGAALRDCRDKAILLYGFASGGRRRSEIAGLLAGDLERHEIPKPGPHGGKELAYKVSLGKTKTTSARDGASVELSGSAALAMRDWLGAAGIVDGPVFRKIDRWGGLSDEALTPKGINDILKRKVAFAGLDPRDYSAHGLRSGFLTQCGRDGISLQEGMEMSLHRDPRTAMRYYNDGRIGGRRAARLLDTLAVPEDASAVNVIFPAIEDDSAS